MLTWIEKRSTGRAVLVLFAATMAVYLIMVLVTIPEIREGSGGVEVFDLRLTGYSEDEARLILQSLPEESKAYYARVQIPIDFAFPFLMALFGAATIAWARKRIAVPRWTMVLPFVAGGFDYLENTFVLFLLRGADSSAMISVANVWTVSKSLFSTVVMTGLIVVLVLFVVSVVRDRSHPDVGS